MEERNNDEGMVEHLMNGMDPRVRLIILHPPLVQGLDEIPHRFTMTPISQFLVRNDGVRERPCVGVGMVFHVCWRVCVARQGWYQWYALVAVPPLLEHVPAMTEAEVDVERALVLYRGAQQVSLVVLVATDPVAAVDVWMFDAVYSDVVKVATRVDMVEENLTVVMQAQSDGGTDDCA